MKKILLLMTVLLSFGGVSVWAQSFEFQYQGQSLEDGATVTIAAEENAFGELSCETNPSEDPYNGLVLKLLSGSTANVKATLQITYNTFSPQILQWCMGGECKPVDETDVCTKKFMVNEVEQVQFDATNLQSQGYLLATLKATVSLESHQVNIQFTNGESAGINALASNPHLKKDVYDLKGCRVKGTLPSGLYIVSDGIHKRKVIVK
jgi:hypothetical protein